MKPEEPAKTDKETSPAPETVKPPERMERPPVDEPMVPLPSTISASLRKMLNNLAVSEKTGLLDCEVDNKESFFGFFVSIQEKMKSS